ncbi:DUF262 domain-containing protein [Roseomonas haemaphysalidis]|uniref:DUF262 domain-containing protein n=1 Tax=Roseomonas haemaphysalidis TaxID=2768162 RepID=A0ABS3KVZ0_9PROT|nr:DUF262 domain-containing protein [Roseomonas haemaphysalidis]MBO1081657.1 DUF262 domain-containing protein [Roseomonas haemaphysalidis]
MQPEYINVGDLFSRENVFAVPLFQRPYVWDEDRWELLWDDITRVTEETLAAARAPRRHFLGSIVVQQRPNGVAQVPRREVIDGQQRLTTLQVLLKAVADALEADLVTADTALPFATLLRHPFAIKTDVEGSYKVWPTNVDRPAFREVMDGLARRGVNAEDRFFAAYRFFRGKAEAWIVATGDYPEIRARRADALARSLRQHLWLIVLNLAEDDQAQVIFETLNARGTPLTPGDLVKNLLMRRAQEEGAPVAALYEKHWRHFDDDRIWQQNVGAGYTARPRLDFFLQQALTVLTSQSIPMTQVYDSFAAYLAATQGGTTATEHLERISTLSLTARRIFLAEEDDADRALIAAARIRAMDFSTALPVLMVLLTDPKRDRADVAQAAIWLESFLVRRMVCGLNTGMYGLFFVDVMNGVAKAGCASDAVRTILAQERSDSTRWPDDEEFGHAWRTYPLYRTLKRGRLNMILRALEMSLRDPELTDPVAVPRTLTIEHILPRQWKPWWPLPAGADGGAAERRDEILHTIGNLTLVKRKLNEKLSNAPWNTGDAECKRAALRQHGMMRLNATLGSCELWDEGAILDRGDHLLSQAIHIWPRPLSR